MRVREITAHLFIGHHAMQEMMKMMMTVMTT